MMDQPLRTRVTAVCLTSLAFTGAVVMWGCTSDLAADESAQTGPAIIAQADQPAPAATVPASVEAAAPLPRSRSIAPKADRVLRAMGSYLGSIKQFQFTADVTYDTLITGNQMVQYGGRSRISVSKPGRLHAAFDGDERQTHSFFNGKTATIHNLRRNVYAIMDTPPKLDDAIDQLVETYGFTVPVADFVYENPYDVLIERVQSGFLVGVHNVDGTPCYHLAFAQEGIDWQIWVQQGPHPLPRKLVITYKDQPGAPQYAARLSQWELRPVLSDASFQFIPPDDAYQIDLLPEPETEAP